MSTPDDPAPFEDSRRLTGPNLYLRGPGAVLETVGAVPADAALAAWDAAVQRACAALDWPQAQRVVRRHRSGAVLALSAPLDQLFTATEVNEWAWCHACGAPWSARWFAPGHPATWDADGALHTLHALAAQERQPRLMALVDTAARRGLPMLVDDEEASAGAGDGCARWTRDALPDIAEVDWDALHGVPVALVTGSNGKTTTVRLLAAIARAHGWRTAHSCTDGVYLGREEIAAGDYSGPAGARAALRAPGVQAAVLETARGGLLRRGLAVQRADVAVVTNISDDHFGEYGIDNLADLAAAKLVVARAIDAAGLLVLNADDPTLVAAAARLDCPIGWFSVRDAPPEPGTAQAHADARCVVRDGHLWLRFRGREDDLGAVAAMPLAFDGRAAYNVANLAAAALAAAAIGIDPATIAATLACFGAERADNPGRLQYWGFGSLRVYVDFAHNPDGLEGLLRVATTPRDGQGRLGLLLGQAGNRQTEAIRELAAVAARFRPDRVLLKDIEGYLRGRAAGEVAGILRAQLLQDGVPADAVVDCLDEIAAARQLLAWARPGDVLVLPTHASDARRAVRGLLDALASQDWQPGQPVPPAPQGATATGA